MNKKKKNKEIMKSGFSLKTKYDLLSKKTIVSSFACEYLQ